ncbi:hypothetical protein CHS0354_007997 [Potamilus streckersoni]|uniref:Uncharacterized protein n=1 Tax=Potamilus streckersoni TaxID=2493646 RepID=A0AAE0VSJ1_9BIVA|nr:hypothetical protein CHS0354_007997 [Potamilus streckersoni]
MIDYLRTASVQACLRDIEYVMKAPLSVILELTENHRFCWFSRDVSLKKLLQPLLSERKSTQNMFRKYVIRYLSVMLDKVEIYLALSMICGTKSCEVIPETEYSIQCLENVLEQCDEGDDIVCVKGLLANIYHQRAEECIKCGNKSDVVYPQAQGKYGVLFTSGVYTAITPHNFLTVHPSTFDFTEESVIPSTAYILFKVILTYCTLEENVNAFQIKHRLMMQWKKAISLFDKWVTYKCELFPEQNDDYLIYLVGITGMIAGDIKRGSDLFQAAIDYTSTFSRIEFRLPTGKEEVQSKWRYHPYRQSKNIRQKQNLQEARTLLSKLRFRSGEVHIKPYTHY